MTRLRHSAEGYRRLLQISSSPLFVLVEGPSDVFFYSRIATAATLGVPFEIRMARELPGKTGGKHALLKYYDFLRRRGDLCSELAGKRTAVAFMVDKDVDDVLRCQRRSEHVIYTDYYSRENYLYAYGAISESIAAILGVVPERVAAEIPADWRVVAAAAWREWIIVCLLTQIFNVNAESNFGVLSRINNPCLAPTNLDDFELRLERLRTTAGVDATTFAAARHRIARLVDARMSAGMSDTIFTGKWYGSFLRHWLRTVAHRTWSDRELETVLLVSIDYSAHWADRLRRRLSDVVRICGLQTAA